MFLSCGPPQPPCLPLCKISTSTLGWGLQINVSSNTKDMGALSWNEAKWTQQKVKPVTPMIPTSEKHSFKTVAPNHWLPPFCRALCWVLGRSRLGRLMRTLQMVGGETWGVSVSCPGSHSQGRAVIQTLECVAPRPGVLRRGGRAPRCAWSWPTWWYWGRRWSLLYAF